MNIDVTQYSAIEAKAKNIYQALVKQQDALHQLEEQVKSMLPKGYWYTYDIDTNWHKPKKYSIKQVAFNQAGFYITVKEVLKKRPWVGYVDTRSYTIERFLTFNIYKTEEAALDAYMHRICPKCGGFMMHSEHQWCNACIEKRRQMAKQFEAQHIFYHPESERVYALQYEDELTHASQRGYNGQHFRIRRLDTKEIIDTTNLWSLGYSNNTDSLPEIEFLKEE